MKRTAISLPFLRPTLGLGGKKGPYFGTFCCIGNHQKWANDHHNFYCDGHFAQNDPFRGKKFQQFSVGKNGRNFVKISENHPDFCLFGEKDTSEERVFMHKSAEMSKNSPDFAPIFGGFIRKIGATI